MHSVDAVLLLDIFLNRQWSVHACVSMWWYAKRFLHPDIVATYDYTFIWDEDLGFEHFNADKYFSPLMNYSFNSKLLVYPDG
ncbi:hypothetical protein HanRHA438_Chr06g0262881 [Helianthus annuus]|nr:hypothetical protein HanRHA438_Chr06g0262881 [Helianthus annuus]